MCALKRPESGFSQVLASWWEACVTAAAATAWAGQAGQTKRFWAAVPVVNSGVVNLTQCAQVVGEVACGRQGVGVVLAKDAATAVEGVPVQIAGGAYLPEPARIVTRRSAGVYLARRDRGAKEVTSGTRAMLVAVEIGVTVPALSLTT
jgi:hypothetical protein